MKKIIVYSTPACPYCTMAKNYLKENNFNFEDIDLSIQKDKVQEMADKSGQPGVPVIDIDGKVIIGFNKALISQELGIN
ncbi:glutaredoxin family protein [bacterium]|nr:glutaredoxin family protein [bacterium]